MRLVAAARLGAHLAPSAVMFGPHETNLCRRRGFTDRSVAYYERRARGGCGVIVTEEASVHVSDWPYERAPLAESCVVGWSRIAAAVHSHGALAVAALGHAGGQGSSAYHQRELWAPSAVPEVATHEVPKVMEKEDIAAVTDSFGAGAAAAVGAGMDGVEIDAGPYSLVRQFLSPLTNQRTDEYGKDRARFAVEVLETVRAATDRAAPPGSPRPVLGLRLSCDELAPWAGIAPEQAVPLAARLAAYVDYVVVVRGSIYSTGAYRPDMHVEPMFNRDLCTAVRAAVPPDVQVVLQGSVVDPYQAELALADGVCDLVEMTRAQIAEPDLVELVRSGNADRVRPCVLCNQACQVRDPRNPVVSCVGEPSAGHETEDEPVGGVAAVPYRIAVVGGGPTGLESARVAAGQGHHVHLYEREPVTGGAARVAAAAPGRERLTALVDWLDRECRRLGVEMHTGVEARPETTEWADVVVVATGARERDPEFTVEPGAVVLGARGVLRAAARGRLADLVTPEVASSGPLLVWDPVGGPVAVSVAELLARYAEVVLATPDPLVGAHLSRTGDLVAAQQRLHAAGVHLVRSVVLRRVAVDEVELEERFTGEVRRVRTAAVVDCSAELPVDVGAWSVGGRQAVVAGDAVAPRTVYEAVLEGRRAAMRLDRGLDRVGAGGAR